MAKKLSWWWLAPAIVAPFIGFVLINIPSVWYGEGFGQVGAAILLLGFVLGFTSSLVSVLWGNGSQRLVAGTLLAFYLLVSVAQFL